MPSHTSGSPYARLAAAIKLGEFEAARQALDDGADAQVNECHMDDGLPPLHAAARSQNLDIMKLLLARGANFKSVSKKSETIFDVLLTPNTTPQFLRDVLDIAGEVDFNTLRNFSQQTPLHTAATRCHANLCEVLLKAGHDPNPIDVLGWTPLHLFTKDSFPHRDSIQATLTVLLQHGANLNAWASRVGRSPFMQACTKGNAAMVGAFLDAAPQLALDRCEAVEAACAFENSAALSVILDRTGITNDELDTLIEVVHKQKCPITESMLRARRALMTLQETVASGKAPPKARI